VVEEQPKPEPTLVDRWVEEQQQWQKTLLTYLDSLGKNEDFLVHLGNAMRGSLLAGKPYPRADAPASAAPETAADERLDRILYALHQIEGQLTDLKLSVDELKANVKKRKDKKKRKGKDEDEDDE
jgi:hypothetical protein